MTVFANAEENDVELLQAERMPLFLETRRAFVRIGKVRSEWKKPVAGGHAVGEQRLSDHPGVRVGMVEGNVALIDDHPGHRGTSQLIAKRWSAEQLVQRPRRLPA